MVSPFVRVVTYSVRYAFRLLAAVNRGGPLMPLKNADAADDLLSTESSATTTAAISFLHNFSSACDWGIVGIHVIRQGCSLVAHAASDAEIVDRDPEGYHGDAESRLQRTVAG